MRQDAAKEVLATKVCTHYNRIKLFREHPGESRFAGVGQIKSNILMLGPTGVGKTYLVKLIARKIGIPFVKGDATKFSETGYVGADVEDLVRDLVREAGGDIRLAEHGIVYIDEIDKIASARLAARPRRLAHRRAARAAQADGGDRRRAARRPRHGLADGGARGLAAHRQAGEEDRQHAQHPLHPQRRLHRPRRDRQAAAHAGRTSAFAPSSGRPTDAPPSWYLHQAAPEDLIAYGFESEFVGRLPVTVVLDPLSEADLFAILRNPNCPVIQGKKADFKAYGIDVHFEDEALRKLATLAHRQRTGARGLASVVEAALLKFEKKLPSTEIRRLVVTPELVDDPVRELARLLADPAAADLAERFERLAAAERTELTRAFAAQAALLGERCRLPVGAAIADLAVRRMSVRGTDAEEACRVIGDAAAALDRFLAAFREKHGITLEFAPEARERIIVLAGAGAAEVEALCTKLFANYPLGLNLLRERTGRDTFAITADAIADPEGYLNGLIRENYAR